MSTALDEQSLSLKVPLKEGNIAETKKITFRTHVKINPRKHCATFAPSTFFEIKKTQGLGPCLPQPSHLPQSQTDHRPTAFASSPPCPAWSWHRSPAPPSARRGSVDLSAPTGDFRVRSSSPGKTVGTVF